MLTTLDGARAEIKLTCSMAGVASAGPSVDDVSILGTTFSGIAAVGPTRPGAISVAKGSSPLLFRKVFLYVTTKAPSRIHIAVAFPEEAGVYYTDQDPWMSAQSEAEMGDRAARSASFENCGSDRTGYFGGVLSPTPGCVGLLVGIDGQPAERAQLVQIPVTGGVCS